MEKEKIEARIKELESLGKKIAMSQRTELATLKAQIGETSPQQKETPLRAVFASDEAARNRIQYIDIVDIVFPKDDDRIGVDDIKELAESIKKNGLIQPIVLKEIENGKFLKIVGRRRIKATESLGIKKIQATIIDKEWSEYDEHNVIAAENLQRKDYSVYEKVELHIKQLARLLNIKVGEAKSLFLKANNFKKGVLTSGEGIEEFLPSIEKVIKDLGAFNTVSTLVNNFKVLTMNEITIDALERKLISMLIAETIHKFKNLENEQIQKAINFVVNQKASKEELEAYIMNNFTKVEPKKNNKEIKKIDKSYKHIKTQFIKLDEVKKEKVLSLLAEIEELVGQ